MCIFWSAVLAVVKVVFVYQIFNDDVMTFVGVVFHTIVKYCGVFLNGGVQSVVYMVTFIVAPYAF